MSIMYVLPRSNTHIGQSMSEMKKKGKIF